MTDNQVLIPNNVGITSDLLYNMKPSSARGRSYRCSIQPTNKTNFNPGDTCVMYIPCGRRNTFLDTQQSYIKYTVVNNDTFNRLYFDNTAASVINRLDIFHASNLLESVQAYNVLYNYLMDYQLNHSERLGYSAVFGMNNVATSAQNTRQGLLLGQSPTANNKITTCMPLLSGICGLGLDKCLPVGNLNDDIVNVIIAFVSRQVEIGSFPKRENPGIGINDKFIAIRTTDNRILHNFRTRI